MVCFAVRATQAARYAFGIRCWKWGGGTCGSSWSSTWQGSFVRLSITGAAMEVLVISHGLRVTGTALQPSILVAGCLHPYQREPAEPRLMQFEKLVIIPEIGLGSTV